MLSEILILICSVLVLIYFYLRWNLNYWKRRGVNGPKPVVLLGNFPNIILQKRNIFLDVDDVYRKYRDSNKFIGVFVLTKPELIITDPSIIQEVLVSKFKNFEKNDVFVIDPKSDPILAQNPFMLWGSEWKEKRSEITPALTVSRIKASHSIMLKVCENMTKYLENEMKVPPKDGINARKLAARYTMEVVANCIYGFEAGAFKNNEKCEIMEMGSGILDLTFLSQIYLYVVQVFPWFVYVYSKPFISQKVQNYFTGLMEYAIKLRKENKSDRMDFLNYLLNLQEKKNLSTFDMAAHTMTFFFDGFETSSVLISNCLCLLAQNENVQDHLRSEIKEARSKSTEDDMFDIINNLPYLEQVINETLRKMSPALALKKQCTESCEFINSEGRSIQISKGDTVHIPVLSIHNDERYYSDPDKFMPERFSEENGGAKNYKDMGVFIPFGNGPRMCLGQRFALAQSKAAVFELIGNWRITLNEKTLTPIELDPQQFIFVPKGGIWLNFERVL